MIVAIALLVVATAPPLEAQAADTARVGGFLVHQFQANDTVARWLVGYDAVAWVTSDLAMKLPADDQKRLGNEWFCFKQFDIWHAVYGRYDSLADRYDLVAHYQETGNGFVVSGSPVDTSRMLDFARALHTTQAHRPSAVRPPVRYNQYIRRLADDRIEVSLLPAWQPNGVIAYGADFRQTLDSTGRTLLDSAYTVDRLRGIRPDTTLAFEMWDEQHEVPTVDDLFFVYAYHKYFASITIFNRRFLSRFLIESSPEQAFWLHVIRRSAPDSTRPARAP